MKKMKMKRRMLGIFAIAALLAGTPGAVLGKLPIQAMKDGADFLVSEQLGDGGWSWYNGGTSASNIAGATGIGLLNYYNLKGGSTYLDAAKDAGDFIHNTTYPSPSTEPRYATFDPYYCWQLSASAGDNTWSNYAVTDFFNPLAAGTYGPSDYTTATWISAVQTGRAGTWVNLLPWEFSTIPVTAASIGNAGQEALFLQAMLDGLNTLDNTDPDNVYCDLIGVAGGTRGLALDGETTFTAISSSNHAGINNISTLSGLVDYLIGQQNTDGSWYGHSGLASPGEGDKDTQTTAYAVIALQAAADALATSDYDDEICDGQAWLVTMQENDPMDTTGFGGFYGFPGDTQPFCNEVCGEATGALPEPATLALMALGGVFVLIRRRRQ